MYIPVSVVIRNRPGGVPMDRDFRKPEVGLLSVWATSASISVDLPKGPDAAHIDKRQPVLGCSSIYPG